MDFNNISKQDFVNLMIRDWFKSDKYITSLKAKKYYKNNNDIKNKKRFLYIDGKKTIDTKLDNNIIAHPIFRDLVDQKIDYLLGNDWNVDNKDLALIFDDNFRLTTQLIATDAIMCGIGWGFASPDNTFHYIDALNIIPIWVDTTHKNLSGVINLYAKYDYLDGTRNIINYAEYWTLEGVTVYKEINQNYIYVEDKPHLTSNISKKNWEKIPFIPLKYNQDEISLLTLVKDLIDKMDITASNTQDLLSDLTNKLTVITGAEGTTPEEIALNKHAYRTLSLPEGGDCKEIGTDPDITSATSWIQHLRNQIYIAGRGYDPLQAIGLNASGDARRNLYTSLDLDVNKLETGVLQFINECIWFINYSPNTSINIPPNAKVKFIRNMLVNQSEQIANAVKAQGVDGLSKETIVSMTGLVENVKDEIKKAEKETQDELNKQDQIYNNFNKKDEE